MRVGKQHHTPVVRYVSCLDEIVCCEVRGYVREQFWMETIDGRFVRIDSSALHRKDNKNICLQGFHL